MTIIAVDYGKVKCGYAVGTLFVAESGTVSKKELFEKIKAHDKVILGLPLSMSGNYSSQTFEVLQFGLKLLDLGKEVYLVDERLTTKMAKTYGKIDDDRFSAEQLLLTFIQNPATGTKFSKKTTECELDKGVCKLENNQTLIVFEVPIDEKLGPLLRVDSKDAAAVGFSRDPYTAYTMFKNGLFVLRVWDDLLSWVEKKKIESRQFCIIINVDFGHFLSDILELLMQENIQIRTIFCKTKDACS
ncbi:Holliday junction resolvase RuvX [Fervidobacterium thailandense]|uniref:Holliday junction resolvase RuvX n=1 Tax=Fervidobacterium thailandense TaxID=1008305 RepID=UPI0008461499|nr:Holliday junction resolvase RuvX [Fervidobacterium thailandense]